MAVSEGSAVARVVGMGGRVVVGAKEVDCLVAKWAATRDLEVSRVAAEEAALVELEARAGVEVRSEAVVDIPELEVGWGVVTGRAVGVALVVGLQELQADRWVTEAVKGQSYCHHARRMSLVGTAWVLFRETRSSLPWCRVGTQFDPSCLETCQPDSRSRSAAHQHLRRSRRCTAVLLRLRRSFRVCTADNYHMPAQKSLHGMARLCVRGFPPRNNAWAGS